MEEALEIPGHLVERAKRFPNRIRKADAAESGRDAGQTVAALAQWGAPLWIRMNKGRVRHELKRGMRLQHTYQLILYALIVAEGLIGRGLTVVEIEEVLGGWVKQRRIQALLSGPLYVYTTQDSIALAEGGYRREYRLCADPSKNKDLTPKERTFVGAMVKAIGEANWENVLSPCMSREVEDILLSEEFLTHHRAFALKMARVHLIVKGLTPPKQLNANALAELEGSMRKVRRYFAFADGKVLRAIAIAQQGARD